MGRLVWIILLLVLGVVACTRSNEPVDLQALAGQARGGDEAALAKLVDLLGVEENQVGDRVYTIVVELGQPAVPALLKAVESRDRAQRERVIAALGTLGAPAAVEPIARILSSASERRYVAAWALGEIGDPAGIPALLKALDDEDGEVRKRATRSLIKLNRAAVTPLVDYLHSAAQRGGVQAIRALGDIADPRALEALLAQVTGENRAEAFLALGKLKDPRAEQALIAGLADRDWQVRMNAAMALGPLGSPATVGPLRKTLEDEVHVVREWSARSLEMITGEHIKYRNEAGEYVAPYSIYH